MTTKNPTKLTVWEAYERYYDKTDLSPKSVRKDRHDARRWERYSGNPPIGEIDDALLLEVKTAMLKDVKPATYNMTRGFVRKVLRRLGPQVTGNPSGLGVLDRIPFVKNAREFREPPERIPLDDLTKFYAACRHATGPVQFVRPPDWWRAWLVLTYFTGLRRGDVFKLTHDQFDLEKRTLTFTASKTRKSSVLLLHEIVVEHLQRIWGPQRDYLFQGYGATDICQEFYKQLDRIRERAGIESKVNPQSLRRTAACEIERVRSGLGSVLLQHAPRGVTATYYLNMEEELSEAIPQMRVPTGFKPGPKMQERAERNAIEQKRKLVPVEYLAPVTPGRQLWRFEPGQWQFNGSRWFRMKGNLLRILHTLAHAERPLYAAELSEVVWKGKELPAKSDRTLHGKLSEVRKRLRECLGLPEKFDPVPCVERGNGTNGAWILQLPVEVMDGRWATGGKGSPRQSRRSRAKGTDAPWVLDELYAHRPSRTFWQIENNGYSYRGSELFTAGRSTLDLLECFVDARGFVSYFQIVQTFYGGRLTNRTRQRVLDRIYKLRRRLVADLELPEGFDPVPFTEAVEGGAWGLQMPSEALQAGKGVV